MAASLRIPFAGLSQATVAGSASGPNLLITAGVHGDEFEPMVAVRQLIERFRSVKLRGRVTLVPVVNEAAFRRAARTASDRLDLARVCPGRADGSITQQTAAALAELIRTADYYIDLHTGGRLYNVQPLAGYTLHTDPRVLDVQRTMARAFNLPIVWGTQGRAEGRSLSVARDAGIPAIYTEYAGGGGDPTAVEACAQGCLNVAAALGLIDQPASQSAVQYFVEDDRDEAGHLQIQHLAPCDGFFLPHVQLGQVVRNGDVLGEISNTLGDQRQTIHIAGEGIVLFLRVVPSVQKGDGLGGLLPITSPGEKRYPRRS